MGGGMQQPVDARFLGGFLAGIGGLLSTPAGQAVAGAVTGFLAQSFSGGSAEMTITTG
jgi:hypothetical protein